MKWVNRWRMEVSAEPVAPHVWALRSGGYVARAKVIDPLTHRERTPQRVFRADATKADALRWIEEQIEAVRAARPVETRRSRMLFATFAASVLARRTASGEIESESTVEKWQWQLDRVLTDRWAGFTWGHLYFDEITRDHCEKWWKYLRSLQDLPRREGRLAETTCNDLIGLFRFLFKLAVAEDVVAKSPAETTLPYFRKRTPTYTRERPNRYTPSQALTS